MLYHYYSTENPIDNAEIRRQFKEFDDILKGLSFEKNSALFSLTCSMCAVYERQACLDGIHVGARSIRELEKLPEKEIPQKN